MDDIVSPHLFASNDPSHIARCCVCKKRKPYEHFHKRIGWLDDKWLVCKVCGSVGKHCSRCSKYLPFSAFPKSAGPNRGGTSAYCKPCMLAYKRGYYKEHGKSEYRIHRERVSAILSKYGLTEEEYQQKFQEQQGLCGACGKPEEFHYKDGTPYRLAVDHDHDTGQIRMLLCRRCNLALGHLQDSPERVQALLAYILAWKNGT